MANITTDFNAIRLKLASPDEILDWSYGEVKKPETINYRTQRPEKDGLFSERIFGPTKDWECYCGKYKRIRYKGIICDKCGVEVTRSIVRRERMGHIELAAPVSHIWFLRGVPSKVGLILDLSAKSLEKVVYFASYLITSVDEKAKVETLNELEDEFKTKKRTIDDKYKNLASELKQLKVKQKSEKGNSADAEKRLKALYSEKEKEQQKLNKVFNFEKDEVKDIKKLSVISELKYRNLSLKYGHVFKASIGAEAVRKVLAEINLEKMAVDLEKEVINAPAQIKKKIKRRLKLVKNLIKVGIRPEYTILTVLPVIPPDLRPMVQLDGGRYAASDLNDLYRRVINRNNRLKRLIELNAPEVICRNEKRMLQEAVDALLDNSARSGKVTAASTGQKRLLKSLADMLKGKQGRFRQNLLGKRVDYSGRSVIVIGPHLKLGECGIPKTMALELFKPFVIHSLIKSEFAHNVRSAGKLIEEGRSEVWDALEEIIADKYVLLNRAPTLHRLGIQAFKPILIEGKALQIHPMVCSAFNADFDGDQMAVHVPLTSMAQKEAKEIMSATHNLLKPATGVPITVPSQDIVLGCYYISNMRVGMKGEGKIFSDAEEAILAYENDLVDIRAKIKVRIDNEITETCVGRIIFNRVLPEDFGFRNSVFDKKALRELIGECLHKHGGETTVKLVDAIKEIGFEYLTRSGLSWGMDDLKLPKEKAGMMLEATKKIEEIRQQYKSGLLTDHERYVKVIETWANVKDKITDVTRNTVEEFGPVFAMVESGARGSWPQIVQMMGMRGLMAAPSGKTIELPVKNSFKEGLGVLEYFISTHGARKGLTDTALRTANAGYLTRRLIDVSQDIIVQAEECSDTKGLEISKKDSADMNTTIGDRILGRTLAQDIKDKSGKIVIKKGEIVTKLYGKLIDSLDLDAVRIFSVTTCKMERGICQKCYGWDLGKNEKVAIGQAVGIIAAQSIGEPGTQLTMRTFHTGGVASEGDIIQGLPRVEELFEARGIKKPAIFAELDGIASIEEEKDRKILRIVASNVSKDLYQFGANDKLLVKDATDVNKGDVLIKTEKGKDVKAKASGFVKIDGQNLIIVKEGDVEKEYILPSNAVLWVKNKDLVSKGQQLTEGALDLQNLFKSCGREAIQKYILKEVQYIYSSQGQDVDDKHVELIIRQMLNWVRVRKSGKSDLIAGDVMNRVKFLAVRDQLRKDGKDLPEADELLLGITKSSLSTDSFLSAASFQETARVLIDASITGKVDELKGLKENVIFGKLIPAGTGYVKKV